VPDFRLELTHLHTQLFMKNNTMCTPNFPTIARSSHNKHTALPAHQWWCLLAAALAADTMPANVPSPVLSCLGEPCSTKLPLLSTQK
jgi:hypothetical protein